MATRPANVPGTLGHARNPSTGSDLSTSSNEDKQEEPSRQILSALLDSLTGCGYPSIQYRGQGDVASRALSIPLGTESKCLAYNDGGLYLTRQGEYTGSDRYGTIPLLSLEAKRRHAGNIRRSAGEEERYSAEILAQEVAQLLGQAMEHVTQIDCCRDQEAFILSLHGTHLKLTAAHFTADYLRHVNSPLMSETETLWVRRSKPHDLKTQQGRAGALQLCIGVYEYLWSGRAEIGLLQKIFE
ncbi:hypothetical protein BO78DRAFT_321397 [Aspergillus sclerotiicarbonarius CBS 121057]|uniref:Uncharacterized protein n=1 Tax=Aspergillus sclerotiicarbonarius (strain CBS 121057 / IBT 28362) TaxID=1448318 RepID=A0A319E1T1_ASPSB|nr:hypothetical protein BO78DRAFT_321397 [Aspergillus sclerotiicarbonarius CBS 121057]